MSYIKNNLRLNEEIKYTGCISEIIIIFPSVFGAFCYFYGNNILLGICIFWFFYNVVYIYTSEFAVTNERIMLKYGLISRTTFDLSIQKIEGYTADQSILGRIVNYGTIIIQGSGGSRQKIRNLEAPMKFRDAVYDAIEALKHNK